MTLLSELVDVSARVTQTRKRTEKSAMLAQLLRRLTPDELAVGVGYLMGEAPQGRTGIAHARLSQAQQDVPAAVEPTLTLLDVDRTLSSLKGASGAGSTGERQRLLSGLMSRGTGPEREFIHRLLVGELRQGALEGVMVEAVAQATGLPSASIRRAAMLAGDLRKVAEAVLTRGGPALSEFALQLGKPIQPMLAQTGESPTTALESLERAAFEFKLDGARVQLHKRGDEVRVFSRGLLEVTPAVPELVEAARLMPAPSLVLDGEAIALSPEGRPLPFQQTMRRFGRKLDVETQRRELPLSACFFDALHVDGVDLLDRPAEERFELLRAQVAPSALVSRLLTSEAEEAERFFDEALQRGHEGLVAKSLLAPYEAGNRGASWLKIKPAHTLDLVILAAEWGHGRRSGLLSNLHLGARDPERGFVMLGKTFKGLTDDMLAWQTQHLQSLEVARDSWVVHVRPELVVEIAFDGVQSSTQYPGGIALRFARVKRYRLDKRAEDADTLQTLLAIHQGTRPHVRPPRG
jgi:DNA ligase 1